MEGFLVSARKYRPLKWSDVIGQEHISRTLKNALSKSQVAHAFLFTGPRGVGKTTCARILARVLNCENPSADWESCNECVTCKAFQENNSFNIIELDAASNNGVDDMRSLVEQVRYQPQYGKYKIYIIDEVHMLTTAAFNAFLKTLEEPPPYAKFILATTEKHKIIPTILSRCQVYDFRRIQVKDIIAQLLKICETEGITAETEALYLIAQKADGAMRDALSIFDRMTSFGGKTLSYQDVLDNLNVLDQDYFFRFYDAFIGENTNQALLLFDEILRLGFDPEVLLEGLGSHARNLLVCQDDQLMTLYDGSEESKQRLFEQGKICNDSFLMTCLGMINEAEINLSLSRNKRLHIEILLARICQMQRFEKIEVNPIPAFDLEKKTHDPNHGVVQEPLPPLSSSISTIQESNSTPTTPPKIEHGQKTNQNKDTSSLGLIPKLGSIHQLKEKIAKEEKEKAENKKEFNAENVDIFWQNCISEQKSSSLLVYMKQAKVMTDQLSIRFLVGSVLSQEALRKEIQLEQKISDFFKEKDIKVSVEIDPEMAQREEMTKPKKLLTAKEKLELMVNANPLVEETIKMFELRLDED
ncbi:MAG: DNA polymerase III subunit gamma/tau [Saprospiraceae bacterium]|nr:DNA polymerase III subunit gamma/tau [Saprospiraceae bacterium]